jgi:hypothetical protein
MQSDSGPSNTRQYAVKPAKRLRYQVKKIGLRKLMRQGLGRRIPQKIWHLEPVKGFHPARVRTCNPAIHLYDPGKKKRTLVITPCNQVVPILNE